MGREGLGFPRGEVQGGGPALAPPPTRVPSPPALPPFLPSTGFGVRRGRVYDLPPIRCHPAGPLLFVQRTPCPSLARGLHPAGAPGTRVPHGLEGSRRLLCLPLVSCPRPGRLLMLFSAPLCSSVALSFYFSDPDLFWPFASLVIQIIAELTGVVVIPSRPQRSVPTTTER